MNTSIYALYPNLDRYFLVNIFGYSSKGIPGVEIVGLGKHGKLIKEKFIYLSKVYKLSLPLKRYVICVEEDSGLKDSLTEHCNWLELPMLILFWSLASFIPIKRLSDCIASGRISVDGSIEVLKLKKEIYLNLLRQKDLSCKYISPYQNDQEIGMPSLPIEDIFESKKGIRFSFKN